MMVSTLNKMFIFAFTLLYVYFVFVCINNKREVFSAPARVSSPVFLPKFFVGEKRRHKPPRPLTCSGYVNVLLMVVGLYSFGSIHELVQSYRAYKLEENC